MVTYFPKTDAMTLTFTSLNPNIITSQVSKTCENWKTGWKLFPFSAPVTLTLKAVTQNIIISYIASLVKIKWELFDLESGHCLTAHAHHGYMYFHICPPKDKQITFYRNCMHTDMNVNEKDIKFNWSYITKFFWCSF